MHKYIVCIGSNYNRKENLTFARQKLTESFSSICFAPELETKPLFFKNPALFSNQVVLFYSDTVSYTHLIQPLPRHNQCCNLIW